MKTFTLEEAQSLLPVLESLLKRATEGKQSADEVESGLTELARRIYLSGGMRVDAVKVARLRAEMESHLKLVRESIAEIDSIGVQVKDLEAGLLDFPCRMDDQVVLLCWRRGDRALAHRRRRLSGPQARGRPLPPPLRLRWTAQLGPPAFPHHGILIKTGSCSLESSAAPRHLLCTCLCVSSPCGASSFVHVYCRGSRSQRPQVAASPTNLKESLMLTVGDKFPAFELTAVVDIDPKKAFETITEDSYPGKWKVVFFWPKDFTFVCPTEIAAFGKLNQEFSDRDAQLLGGSIDSEFVHLAWRNNHPDLKDLPFPMLSDIKRELSAQLGILDVKAGVSQRATFIVDPEGVIRFVYVTDLSVGRNPQEVLRVLDALQTDELCPCNWHKGEETIHV
jgi:peroxiredoxin (alkyl hydroperoxide reductase subunit C)